MRMSPMSLHPCGVHAWLAQVHTPHPRPGCDGCCQCRCNPPLPGKCAPTPNAPSTTTHNARTTPRGMACPTPTPIQAMSIKRAVFARKQRALGEALRVGDALARQRSRELLDACVRAWRLQVGAGCQGLAAQLAVGYGLKYTASCWRAGISWQLDACFWAWRLQVGGCRIQRGWQVGLARRLGRSGVGHRGQLGPRSCRQAQVQIQIPARLPLGWLPPTAHTHHHLPTHTSYTAPSCPCRRACCDAQRASPVPSRPAAWVPPSTPGGESRHPARLPGRPPTLPPSLPSPAPRSPSPVLGRPPPPPRRAPCPALLCPTGPPRPAASPWPASWPPTSTAASWQRRCWRGGEWRRRGQRWPLSSWRTPRSTAGQPARFGSNLFGCMANACLDVSRSLVCL